MGMAIVHVQGELALDWVVFAEPDDIVLLGAQRGRSALNIAGLMVGKKREL